MKTIKKQLVIAAIILFGFSLQAQDQHLMTLGYVSANIELADDFKEYDQIPMLYNQTFTYKYKGGDVMVYFNGNEHIEYYNNKENYIKSNIVWINKDECIITLEEVTLPNFPFKPGNSLKMKITDVKGKYVHYESTLGGRTWKGKMKEVDTTQEDIIASN